MSGAPDQAGLLVVVEPGLDPDDAGMAALGAEAARISAALDGQVTFATWPDDVQAPAGAIADAISLKVRAARPVAVLLLDTDLGRQLAPMVARRCGGGSVVGCSDVTVSADPACGAGGKRLVFGRPVFGGWLRRELVPDEGAVSVVTLDFAGAEASPEDAKAVLAEPELLAVSAGAGPAVRHLETLPPDARSVDLVHARRIVTAGHGAVGGELLSVVQELADLLDGSIGATRPVTDEALLPKERLIGQTGRSVAPELYLALGVSGSPHHVAGVRGADRVLSVNRDARAPVFQYSDVGYVADLEEVLPGLVRKISEWRREQTDA